MPSCLNEEYLERLHYGHLSARKVQENARQHLYWSRLDADITDYIRRWQECIHKAHPPKEPLLAQDVPSQPWECIAMDHFYCQNRLYLLVCDYFSKFPFIFQAKSTSRSNLKSCLAWKAPQRRSWVTMDHRSVAENSTAFFQALVSNTPPNYPQSNGFIERQIQTMKRLMEKANSTGMRFQEALTSLRATPAEILHGRSLVTRMAISFDFNAVQQHLIALQAKYIKQHDKARWARSQRTLVRGEEVYHLTSGNNWVIGIVSGTRDLGRIYDILTEGGTTLRKTGFIWSHRAMTFLC